MPNMTHLDQDEPPEMASQRIFRTLSPAAGDGCAPRLGRLALPGRSAIDTPNYTSFTSRGVVPHLTPDVVSQYTTLPSAYMALEDFWEKKDPPVLQTPPTADPDSRPLRAFTAFPRNVTTILGPRRVPAVTTPAGNTAKNIGIFTSTGFTTITVQAYADAVRTLRPDIAVPVADLLHTSPTPAPKKQLRMAERTEDWVDEFLGLLGPGAQSSLGVSVFAPVLAVEHPIQWSYLSNLSDDHADKIAGLAVYGVDMLPELGGYKPLMPLPRLSLDIPASPHHILRQVLLGIDMVMVPFVNAASDAGVALSFTLNPYSSSSDSTGTQPLGIDMWSPEHATSLAPLADGCPCHTCQRHHRAYVHHLLSAREMLGWNLLQIHNHHVVDAFFAAIRKALQRGVPELEAQARRFATDYEPELPEGTGQRPRARGYHFKSEASQEKLNKPAWNALADEQSPAPPGAEGGGGTVRDSGS